MRGGHKTLQEAVHRKKNAAHPVSFSVVVVLLATGHAATWVLSAALSALTPSLRREEVIQ